MKISERLGEIITGDKGLSPYRGGPKLVSFFNEFGTNHTYGQGFPSRWMFTEECIRQFNGTPTMKKIILSAVDPRDFMSGTIFDKETNQNKPANVQDALTYLNEFLAFDGYEIVPHGTIFQRASPKGVKVLSFGSSTRTLGSARYKIRGRRCSPDRFHREFQSL